LIPYIGMGMPMAVYLCTEFIKGIPDSVVESARIDGASYLKILQAIIWPMTRPVAVTLAILNIAGVWNEFMLINILVSSESLRTLPVGILRFSSALSSDYGRQFAALVIGMLPMVIFYLVFRNQITKGVSAGAIKG
jgi:raffinose/stachyose/melibiose transport system permease protein